MTSLDLWLLKVPSANSFGMGAAAHKIAPILYHNKLVNKQAKKIPIMTSFSYALVMMHAILYIRVQDTGGHERLLTPEPLQRREENRTSYCAQRHERRYQ